MRTDSFTQKAVSFDNFADYMPGLSTVTNLVDIFQKSIINMTKSEKPLSSSYYAHLQNKSFLRCFTLLIPILGNIIIAIVDLVRHEQSKNLYKEYEGYLDKSKNTLIYPPAAQEYFKSFALQKLSQAAHLGHPKAMEKFAETKTDINEAIYWYTKAACRGVDTAAFTLGHLYFFNKGGKDNKSLAIEWWNQSALMGNVEAMCSLGESYLEGLIGEKSDANDKKGFEWLKKASDGNHPTAKILLSQCYKKGIGTTKDRSIAETLIQEAHNLGYSPS